MPYPIFDIDITKPLPPISISDEDTGVAVLLRQDGKPIDFLMEALPSNRVMKLKQLTQRIREMAREYSSEECRNQQKWGRSEPFRWSVVFITVTPDEPPDNLLCQSESPWRF